jgi:hypothetical protein
MIGKSLLLIFLLFSNARHAQEYLQKYAGAYTIVVSGYSGDASEAYALKPDGNAVWIYGWRDGHGKLQTQKKYGTWSTREGYLRISIAGNTGKIIEEYKMKNGRFVSTDSNDRYLKKTN